MPPRSALYVPGSKARALEKAPTLGADALIIDLEDSVAPDAKEAARRATLQFLRAHAGESELFCTVRINALHHDLWRDDLEAVLPGAPDALVVPKVEHFEDLMALESLLETHDSTGEIRLWAMIESPLAVLNAFDIARHPRVSALMMGTSDLTRELRPYNAMLRGNEPDRSPFHTALQQVVLAGRAAGVNLIDGVYVDLKDVSGFAAECQEGLRLGFDGKSVIHPSQIGPANTIFLPSDEELQRAKRILDAWHAAQKIGDEVCVVEGRLVERLHAAEAAFIMHRRGQATP
ncbi:MAG: CoA ester lyase [Magnetococcales bacterium]|nr:CoA ester lyase [Magnetococcales bacterium]